MAFERGLDNRMIDDEAISIIAKGRDAMPPIPVRPDDREKLIAFLFNRVMCRRRRHRQGKTRAIPTSPMAIRNYWTTPATLAQKPPWGTLNAINLNTGKIAWKVPLGEYPELTRRGIPKTGTENFGGATVTAGGVVFCAGTRHNKIRAFDKTDGRELWSYTLPFGGFASPATYQVNGQQYVVIASTGGGKMGGPLGDAYVAFALGQSRASTHQLSRAPASAFDGQANLSRQSTSPGQLAPTSFFV